MNSTIKQTQRQTLFFFLLDMACLYGFIAAIQSLIDRLSQDFAFSPSCFWILLGLLAGMVVCGFCSQYGFHMLPVLGKKEALERYERRLMAEDHSFFETHSTAFCLSLFQNEISLLAQQKVTFPVVFLYQSFSLIAGAAFLFFNEWRLALFLFGLIGACFFLTHVLSKKIASHTRLVLDEKNKLFQILHENIEAHRVIRFLNKEAFFSARFCHTLANALVPAEKTQALWNAQYVTIYSILSRALPLLGSGIGLMFVALGWMGIGKVVSTYALMSLIQEPIMQLAEIRTQKHTMAALQATIDTVFVSKPRKSDQSYDFNDPIQKLDVQIEQFAYSGSPAILSGLSFSIEAGRHTKLAGPSGAGKSTLMALIMGVVQGKDARVYFNGVDGSSLSPAWRSRHVLLVDQKPKWFAMSMLDNITLGDSFSKAQIDEVIHACVLEDVLKEHSDAIHELSQGQAQRVSIARMLLRQPDVLILDEPISALDERTVALFLPRLKAYAQQHSITLLISSHNEAVDALCAQTIALKKA
ncbi:ABC transporter ATP-binding protein [uncultured Dubosiella sp.]|uniref:ATP-binding cassette domain-containing protein n=1 Tax=uncultured Dubosiella sp. TaxID=1937011 RepID=UPI0027309C8B|nr:ABC transporter ATP-binding protein [uncultured Dubosiella sp.]